MAHAGLALPEAEAEQVIQIAEPLPLAPLMEEQQMSSKEEKNWKRLLGHTIDSFFPIACVFLVTGGEKKMYMEFAELAFDFAERWHKQTIKAPE